MANILPNTDAGLITAENSALVFIAHQPQMPFGVASGIDRQLLVNNVLLLARGAKIRRPGHPHKSFIAWCRASGPGFNRVLAGCGTRKSHRRVPAT